MCFSSKALDTEAFSSPDVDFHYPITIICALL